METWKELFPNYFISTCDNLDSTKRGKRRRMKPSVSEKGYLKITLSFDGVLRYFGIRQLVAMAFLPNPLNKPEVNHLNGIKSDNRVENLQWATHSEKSLRGSIPSEPTKTRRAANSPMNKRDS